MTRLFIAVLNMSITASYIAFAVIVIRQFIKKLPKVFSYVLWLPVFVRLVCPFSFSSAFSVLKLFKPDIRTETGALEYIPRNIGLMQAPAVNSGISSINDMAAKYLPKATPAASANPMQFILWAAVIVWVAGILALLAYSAVSYIKTISVLKTATLTGDNVFETDRITTPFLCGFLKPKIFIPLGTDETEKAFILKHELTHMKRLDYIIKPLSYLVLLVHWFNPLIWLSFVLMSKDMEMSCDESVIREMGGKAKAGYSNSLLAQAIRRSGLVKVGPLAFRESNIKARVKNILNYRRPALWVTIIAAAATAALFAACTSNPAQREATPTAYMGYAVNELIDNSTPYVGNNSRVIALINAMPWPSGMTRETCALQTKSMPYGITVHFKAPGSSGNDLSENANSDVFYRNSIVLFSLIGNVGEINFIIDNRPNNSGEAGDLTYKRENMNGIGDRTDITGNQNNMKEFLKGLQSLGNNSAPQGTALAQNVEDAGNLSFPCLISKSEVSLSNGTKVYVNIEMTDGKYYASGEVPPGGNVYSENYEGKYRICVVNPMLPAKDRTLFVYPGLEKDFGNDAMNTDGNFKLVFDDYNNDGNPEFTLGQWGGSNGDDYNLYSIDGEGRIKEICSGLYISGHDFSIPLEKVGTTGFSVKYYDQMSGQYKKQIYRWSNGKFGS